MAGDHNGNHTIHSGVRRTLRLDRSRDGANGCYDQCHAHRVLQGHPAERGAPRGGVRGVVPRGLVLHGGGCRPLGATDADAFCRELPVRAGVVGIPLTAFVTPEHRGGYAALVRFAACKRVEVLRESRSPSNRRPTTSVSYLARKIWQEGRAPRQRLSSRSHPFRPRRGRSASL